MKRLDEPPSAQELDGFLAELAEEEIYVLPCGGGTATGLANSTFWLRWTHGKRQLLRLAVHLYLSGPRDDDESGYGRLLEILFRYRSRRLVRELIELRVSLAASAGRDETSQRLSKLDDLIRWLGEPA